MLVVVRVFCYHKTQEWVSLHFEINCPDPWNCTGGMNTILTKDVDAECVIDV